MTGLLIAGAGGHAKVIAEAAAAMAQWRAIAFLDDTYPAVRQLLGWPIIGTIADAEYHRRDYPDLALGIGDNERRLEWLKRMADLGFRLPAIVHPRAYVSASAELGPGTVVFAQAAVNASARIGKGTIINTGATIDHDCILAEGVHVSPGAHLAGEVRIGRCSWIGIGAAVIQRVMIGENVMIGAGSAVIHDMADGVTAVGVPARMIKHNEQHSRA